MGERTGGAAAENLGAGVADLLEGELDRCGLAVCERRSIALVLSEHRLIASGQTAGAAAIIHRRLPAVGFLLRGTVETPREGAVALSVTVVDTGSGEEVSTLRQEGSEAALAGTVSALAARLANTLGGRAGAARPHRSVPGFTTIPEVALLHYRGLAEMLADRPEYAVAFFTEAARADPAFAVARRWKARAYERLGLPEFAAAARRPLAGNTPEASAGGGEGRRLVAVVAAGPGTDAVLAAFKERLPAVAPTLAVMNPGLIDALAAESDLRLGGLFEGDGGLSALQGIGADGVVGLERVPAADGRPARLRATAVGAGSGELLAREEVGGTSPGDAAALAERVGRALSGGAGTAPGAGNGEAASNVPSGPPRYRWPVSVNLGRDRLAQTLYHLVRCPKDRWAWVSLAWLYEGAGTSAFDPDSVRLAWDGLAASVDPREPDAATWLSTALWGKRWAHPNPFQEPKSFAEEFAPLLRDYPDSLAADVVRFAVANEHLEARRFAPAAEILLPLADRLAGSLPAEEFDGNSLRASVLYDAALAAAETGRRAEAAQFLARAEETIRRADPKKGSFNLLRSSGWVYQNSSHFGGQLNYTAPRDSSNTPGWAGFGADLAALRTRLDGGPAATVTTPAAGTTFTWPREEFARMEKAFGRERLQMERDLVTRLADAADRNPSAYRDALAREPQGVSTVGRLACDLLVLARTGAERETVSRLAARLAAPLPPREQAALAWDAGDRALEVEVTRRRLAAESNPREKLDFQADLLRLTQGREVEADFLWERFRADFPARRQWGDEDRWFPLAFRAARAYRQTGRWDRAAEAFGGVAARTGRLDWWCSASLFQAECEARRGNPVKAAALLRTVLDWSQGDAYPVQYGTGGPPGDIYSLAAERLRELRRSSLAPPRRVAPEAPAAGPLPGDGPIAPPAGVPRDPAVAAELEEMIFDAGLRHPHPPTSNTPDQVFAQRHGHAAVPALLDALERQQPPPSLAGDHTNFDVIQNVAVSNRLSTLAWLLGRTAAPADAPHVLAAFRRFPNLADAAFRLAPREAAVVFDHLVRESGGQLDNFVEVVTGFHLDAYLDGLFEEVAAGEDQIDRCASALSAMLDRRPDPAAETRLRDALEQGLEQRRQRGRWTGLNWAVLRDVAGRRGVPQFIECILDHPSYSPGNRARLLRPILALPPTPPLDDAALLQLAEANRGRWQWQPADRRFHPPPTNP